MKNKYLFFLLILVAFCCPRCQKELDMNDYSKQVTITYAILNPSEPVQYFKIYKGFLTEGNAEVAAQDIRNLYYHVDSIDVKLIEYDGNNIVKTITMDTTTAIDKEEGFFPTKQLLYYTEEEINENSEYELVITLASGQVVRARVPVCGNFKFQGFLPGEQLHLTFKTMTLNIGKSNNAKAYDLYQIFYYIEVDKKTGKVTEGSVKRKINGETIIENSNTQEGTFTYSYDPRVIYSVIANELEPKEGVVRYRRGIECLEFIAWAAGEELYTYIESNTPTSSLVTDKKLYTNFISDDDSGYGIFSSKNVVLNMFTISERSEDTLVRGSKTSHLGFDYYRNYPGNDN